MHPTRSEINTRFFTTTGRICLNRALLEIEKSFFANTTEETFSGSGENCDVSLSNREKSLLLTYKRTCFSINFSSPASDWNDCRDECNFFYVKYFMQCKAHER